MTSKAAETPTAEELSPRELTLGSIRRTFTDLRPGRDLALAEALETKQVWFGGTKFATSQVVFDKPYSCPPTLSQLWQSQLAIQHSGKRLPDDAKFLWELDLQLQVSHLRGHLQMSDLGCPSLVCDFFLASGSWMLELVVALRPNLKQLAFLPLCNQFRYIEW
ncbi:MAG TPA: hypothetical protein VFO38_06120 [Candidatus Saccharimonadales bacterium]|nr:hypothetical protein [Candidatus Saccharimonadales bacterium]